ncbi:hypothetical protein ACH4HG_22610 [Streptomyces coeruleorubidus]|uniref:hypothetical protein n=1 Tax=Streptomyces TaxID=1883 RepID=UPI0015D5661A|nr:hypothetical protein [Streptomyces sp. JV178]
MESAAATVSLDAGDPPAIGPSCPSSIDRRSTSLLVGPGQMRTLTIPMFIK